MKILNTEQMVESLQEVINFIECKVEDPKPEIIAKETFKAEYMDPWPAMAELKKDLDKLADRVTTHNEDRYQQTRSVRDDMLREIGSLWNRLIFLAIGWAITTVILLYEISKDAPMKPTINQTNQHESMDTDHGPDPPS